MKKALAFILASFVFASVFFKSIPTKASDYAIPFSGWLPVIYDIFYSLVNGNTIDVAQLAGDLTGINGIIEKYNELRANNYDSPFEFAINRAFLIYAASMYEGDLYDFAADYSLYLKDGVFPILGKYSIDRIARWNQYNTQFNDQYLENFNSNSDTIVATPDPDYVSYINFINNDSPGDSRYFYFKDYTFNTIPYNSTYNNVIMTYPYSAYSWFSSLTNLTSNDSSQVLAPCNGIITANIVYNGTNYTMFFGFDLYNNNIFDEVSNNYMNRWIRFYRDQDLAELYVASYNISNVVNRTGSLADHFNYLQSRFKNINIYVDNEPWAIVGDNSDTIIAPSVIRNDNGLIDSQDVFVPDQELAFDLIGLINLLEDALQNQDTISFDDIINDGTILKNPDGTALDDARAHILQNTIQRVIADEFERDDPEPIPTTTPPPYPTFPEVDWRKNPIPEPLPTGFDTSNGNPADAFSGASTLAQIVDATNRGLPSELVYTFWGIVFGMIVLGIIKVLHK